MNFVVFDVGGNELENWIVYSVGGGVLVEDNKQLFIESLEVYFMNSMIEILDWCEYIGKSYWEYVKECEDFDIWDYLKEVWDMMKEFVQCGFE